jgi:hypothetical protein
VSRETALYATLKRNLAPYGRAVRFENREVGPGTPDVYLQLRGRSSWLELKKLDRWPADRAAPVTIPHLRLEQVGWLETERAHGGRAYLLLRVQKEYLLLDPSTVRDVLRRNLTREQLEARAVVRATGAFPTLPLVRYLTT